MASDRYVSALRSAGLRVTAPRLATLAVVDDHQHSDAEFIAQEVRGRLGSVSTQAVYDVLHALTEKGLVRRIAIDSRKARFEIHTHDNHHHMVCTNCGRIENVPCVKGEAPCLEPEEHLGFDIGVAEVLFMGLCPACRDASDS
ncbi:Fur family transcriptional regulator [Flaviflexus equikiangi]|uniref:Transcriptional repressor n=1 Tax=Flaviflexus equikiangi TaxID=2758573 RepID=A0ABS2TD16_9ACTO|nr:Fur family transcriptional regulator [Flaviflexus equikiangi]MBM9432548.1 transcriptional repressor [Flaviflexus equikiangi]